VQNSFALSAGCAAAVLSCPFYGVTPKRLCRRLLPGFRWVFLSRPRHTWMAGLSRGCRLGVVTGVSVRPKPRLANLGLSMTSKRFLRSGLRCMPDGTVEIITGKERRRRWSVEEKLRIVAEAEEPGVRIAEVAARHEVYPSLLFNWRRQVREGRLAPRCLPQFVCVLRALLALHTKNDLSSHSPPRLYSI
jgi:hypothetical protein